MPPKEKKQKKAKKTPAYLTAEADLQPFGVQVGQLVRNALGCSVTVLGVRAAATGEPLRLWVRHAGGLEAPAEHVEPCAADGQLKRDIQARQQEAQALGAKWQAYNVQQAAKEAEARKAAAKKQKKQAEEAATEAGGAAAIAAPAAKATAAVPQGGHQQLDTTSEEAAAAAVSACSTMAAR